jgi:hypothetical protein
MRLETYLSRAFPILCLLGALGPGLAVVKMLRARVLARTITQYGPLPEIPVTALDYITLLAAVVLLVAALLELTRLRLAAPLALTASVALWSYYIPGLWDQITGEMWFAMKLGRSLGVSWQMVLYEMLTMLCAGALTYIRFWPRSSLMPQ